MVYLNGDQSLCHFEFRTFACLKVIKRKRYKVPSYTTVWKLFVQLDGEHLSGGYDNDDLNLGLRTMYWLNISTFRRKLWSI